MAELLSSVSSSLNAFMREYDTISQNLANVNTPGYKRRISAFSRVLQEKTRSGKPSAPSLKVDTNFDFEQGTIVQTERKLDLAINGAGFFVVDTPQGQRYTRCGVFKLNNIGQIVDMSGNIIGGSAGAIVSGKTNPVVIPGGVSIHQIDISRDGTVSAAGAPVGRLAMVDFGDETMNMKPAGGNSFAAPEGAKPTQAKEATISQGFYESSNVEQVQELVRLITISRMYEANMKVTSSYSNNSKNILSVAMS